MIPGWVSLAAFAREHKVNPRTMRRRLVALANQRGWTFLRSNHEPGKALRKYWVHPGRLEQELNRDPLAKTSEDVPRFAAYVYFIQAGEGGPIKIGHAIDPAGRLRALQTACPFPLRMIGTIAGGAQIERQLHSRLRSHRLRGEWFHASEAVLQAVEIALRESR